MANEFCDFAIYFPIRAMVRRTETSTTSTIFATAQDFDRNSSLDLKLENLWFGFLHMVIVARNNLRNCCQVCIDCSTRDTPHKMNH